MILDDFESFIKFRIGTGYAGYAMNYAKRYAQFLYSNYGNEEEVTEEMLQEYLKLHPHNMQMLLLKYVHFLNTSIKQDVKLIFLIKIILIGKKGLNSYPIF